MNEYLGLLLCLSLLLAVAGCDDKKEEVKYWSFESNCETVNEVGCTYKVEDEKVVFESNWITLTNYNDAYEMTVVLTDSEGESLTFEIQPGGVIGSSEIKQDVEYSVEVFTNAPEGQKVNLFIFDADETPEDIIRSYK